MYIFFDCETTGVPKDYKGKMSDVDNWPRITQFAYAVYDKNRELQQHSCDLVKPNGWEVPKEKFFIDNNMSTERCEAEGLHIHTVLSNFIVDMFQCEYMIAHNLAFDYPIVGAELIRANLKATKRLKGICTMALSTEYCALPSPKKSGYKWPKLEELHMKLFNEPITGAHDALGDVKSTAKCFFELLERQIIKL